ncbi:hypothetical protein [Liquorilactobacillus mali]|uniref:Uncharacterized protein n=2 Tax=Liquorilactobacillus mali TaxID=1618 RepID=A0A0R2E066_9LACO|nr:hypothetical protein [Liquorilactobacillus mali]KRN08902.1 hypothetical protein FD00_GL001683 [Liquorilactobacillus mali KCTC 3596 = DSM 20444]KRN27260.1 hypothetical protein IV36_GL001082 [Liquorilactobacillus mali]MDC7952814.1 hypothetical protein [Liquorilactobacillus mali]
MTENIIASLTGVLLIFSGFLSKNVRFKEMGKPKNHKINYLYIFAGIILIISGIIQQF